jgi:hypothetical protein
MRTPRRHPVIRSQRSNRSNRCSVLALPELRTSAIIAERRLTVKTSAISTPSLRIVGELEAQSRRIGAMELLANAGRSSYFQFQRCWLKQMKWTQPTA